MTADAAANAAAPAARAARPRIQSVARAADILIALAESEQGLTTKEISQRLGISRQGTYHLIHTLIGAGLLTRTEGDRYVLGLRVGTLAAAFERHLTPSEHLAPYVRALARDSGETAYAAGWRNGEIVVLSVAKGDSPVQAADVVPGTAEDGHARASGKLLLAFATHQVREQYLQTHRLRRRTPNTITSRRVLDKELAAIRTQGYAVDLEEFADGLSCLAVPVDSGASPFVFGLSIPAQRFADPRDRERYLSVTRERATLLSAGTPVDVG